ncbi:prepronociceptin-like isoform X2 [Clupea harengus]|nr:prepronociceptin-like isoform X2 [Clupea harengus]
MKSQLWMLVFIGLFVPGHSDCQGDCLSCLELLPKDQAFNTLVCLLECHSHRNISPGLSWEVCRKVVEKPQLPSQSLGGAMLKRSEEDVPEQGDGGGLVYSEALQRFDHMARALGLDQQDVQSRTTQLESETVEGNQEDEEGEEEVEGEEVDRDRDGGAAAINLTKRFGGFLKGKYGYKKLVNPGRSYQKRYGGFIGVRKSARKWNNQKRFTEFLKQYLGMSTRASEYNSVSADLTQQNEV